MADQSGNNGGLKPVKVVIINTQFVETDAMSFKSVVQMLTGKDSSAMQPEQWGTSLKEQPSLRQAAPSCPTSFRDFERMLGKWLPLEEFNMGFLPRN